MSHPDPPPMSYLPDWPHCPPPRRVPGQGTAAQLKPSLKSQRQRHAGVNP